MATISSDTFFGACWVTNDQIIFSSGYSELKILTIADKKVSALTTLKEGHASHRLPHHISGTQILLYSVYVSTTSSNDSGWALNLIYRGAAISV
ncbi:MAG TPA: hypothetical protein EYG51_03810 [Pseudomonadales bacterium]|nr:hypothetical protein [Pseudomonadales bacterium]